MVYEGLRSFVFTAIFVLIVQFIVYGYSPLFILSKLSLAEDIRVLLILLAFSSVIGVITWYENEKNYYRIYFDMKKNNAF